MGSGQRRRPSAPFVTLSVTLLAAVLLTLALTSTAAANTFVANKRGDHAPDGCTKADCTLREAVIRANNHDGPDRVELPSEKPYRLKLAPEPMQPSELSGDLNVDDPLTILHPGSGRAKIDAQENDRVIEHEASLRLRRLVLRGGAAQTPPGVLSGGAILARAELKVIASRIVGNRAPGFGGGISMAVAHEMTLRSTTVADNSAPNGGGGIFFAGSELKIIASTVARNLAGCKGICLVFDEPDGGGLRVAMPALGEDFEATIKRSTFVDNEAFESGGAIANEHEELRIVNSTITRNRADDAGGGLYGAPDSLTRLNAATIARNRADDDDDMAGSGGGIFADGGFDFVRVRNSLVALNRATGGAIQECDAPAPVGIESFGGNLITEEVAMGCDFFDHPQDILDPEPRIGALDNYGGPTKTIKLKAGSPAINEADGPNPPGRDQRGVQRQDADIGAFERQ